MYVLNLFLLLSGVVIAICVLLNRVAEKLPLPSLILFIALGMCFGENGFLRIEFNDYALSETICSVALVFIMFYGGFGTNIRAARPVAAKAFVMSTAGVALTAGGVGVFIRFALKLGWAESFLIGSVIASTDAASVFGVLRSKKLSLKCNTDSLLELESGSNDPMAYMLTLLMICVIKGENISVPLMLLKQLFIGAAFGIIFGKLVVILLNRLNIPMAQGKTIFMFSAAVTAYAVPALLGGNGYLSVYLCGILIGNSFVPEKRDMVKFFDALTGVAQMVIFFLLGLLVTPKELPNVFLPAILIFVFLTFVCRPAVTCALLAPFRAPIRQIWVVSWAGFRGVASIVFSIYAVLDNIQMRYNLFNLVFVIVIVSIGVQGALLPSVSKKLKMIDSNSNVMRTFNDYEDDSGVSFIKLNVGGNHPYAGKKLRDAGIPRELLVVLVVRGREEILPDGETDIRNGDLLIIAAPSFQNTARAVFREIYIGRGHKYRDRKVSDITSGGGALIIMVKRGGDTLIPNGDTVIKGGDTLVIARRDGDSNAIGVGEKAAVSRNNE